MVMCDYLSCSIVQFQFFTLNDNFLDVVDDVTTPLYIQLPCTLTKCFPCDRFKFSHFIGLVPMIMNMVFDDVKQLTQWTILLMI